MYQLFSKKNIPTMKKLLEGLGNPVENKYGHPFTGFKGAKSLITCNALCYPFVEPESSRSGFNQTDYKFDNEAMQERVELIQFTKKFRDTGLRFDETEWAQSLLYMFENFDRMPIPVNGDQLNDEQIDQNEDDQIQGYEHPPVPVLLA